MFEISLECRGDPFLEVYDLRPLVWIVMNRDDFPVLSLNKAELSTEQFFYIARNLG